MMSALELYAKIANEAKGMFHIGAIRNLRMYINTTKQDQLRLEIERITDTDLLRTLIEAGLNAYLQKIVTHRYDEIQKSKAGGM